MTTRKTVQAPGLIDLRRLSAAAGIDFAQLAELNASLTRGVTPPGGYLLRLPADFDRQRLSDPSAPLWEKSRVHLVEHRVGVGETLASLSRRFGTTEAILRDVNHLTGPPRPGDTLSIPRLPPAVEPSDRFRYEVRRGDTLAEIAQRHRMSVARLLEVNPLPDPDRLEVGQSLWLTRPPSSTRIRRPTRTASYRVRRGDSLALIARTFGVTVDQLVDWNQLPRMSVRPGQMLIVEADSR